MTTTDAGDIDSDDGEWTEFHWSQRPFPAVFAGVDEVDLGLPLMRFYAEGIGNGQYEVFGNLYTAGSKRYYYGWTPDDPYAHYVDTVDGAGGGDEHEEYSLGTVEITDGTFNIYVQDADLLSGVNDHFGWAWVQLMPSGVERPTTHYITACHEIGEFISTGDMALAGLAASQDTDLLAMTGDQPFLVAATSGQGRAVQWGSYDWMSVLVKGPLYGLDDLVWRSIVWAARKPFVMQGLPPFTTMRVDDTSSPLWWVEIANDFGFKPWMGLFTRDFTAAEATYLSDLIHAGWATASMHAFSNWEFFYYDHFNPSDWPDETITAHFAEATQWHQNYDVPISKFVVPHYYEFGTNVFQGLSDWGVEFVLAEIDPGTPIGSLWVVGGPYRLYEPRLFHSSPNQSSLPVYYADFLTVPGHPGFNGQFFNCMTDTRTQENPGWYPADNDVPGSIERGTEQITRALDSMVLATLYLHETNIQPISPGNWQAILAGIANNIVSYEPEYVTMDYACQYIRAMHTSDISSSTYEQETRQLAATLSGQTDMPTKFRLFTERDGSIQAKWIDVPSFNGSIEVIYHDCLYDIPADLNGDCKVDFVDLAMFADHWLVDSSLPP